MGDEDIKKLKEQIEALIQLQGLTLAEINEFRIDFSRAHLLFAKLKDLLECSDDNIKKIKKATPVRAYCKWETLQKGIGFSGLEKRWLENNEINGGYEFERTFTQILYEDGKKVEWSEDDPTRQWYQQLLLVDLNDSLSKEEMVKLADGEEEPSFALVGYFRDAKIRFFLEGGKFTDKEGEGLEVFSVPIFNHLEMKKHLNRGSFDAEVPALSSYFFRNYSGNELGCYWSMKIKDFIATPVHPKNMAELKKGMDHKELYKLLGRPIKLYRRHQENHCCIQFYWTDPHDLDQSVFDDDYMVPVVVADGDYKVAGFGWPFLKNALNPK